MFRFTSLFAVFLALSACTGEDSTRRYEGAGLSLYSETQTPKATQDLVKYFDQLCGQANIGRVTVNSRTGAKSFACPPMPTPENYATLMQAGFNDIDLRCDRYLGWIDRKRIEALSYRRSAGALEALFGAGMRIDGAGADSFAGLLAVFSFARDIYDASNFSLLAALESSTIKSIVYKRQKAFRAAANAHSGKRASRESVVFALRNYLLICTPQTIVLDANTFTRDPSAGSPEALRADIRDQFKALAPVTSRQNFGATGNLSGPRNQTCRGRDQVFSDAPETYGCDDIETVQKLLCFARGRGLDGKAGPATTSAIKEFEFAQLGRDAQVTDPKQVDGLLSETEFRTLASAGCLNNDSKLFRSVFERSTFAEPDDDPNRIAVIEALNFCFPQGAQIPADANLDNKRLRTRVKEFRKRFELGSPNSEVISRDVFSKIGDAQSLCTG